MILIVLQGGSSEQETCRLFQTEAESGKVLYSGAGSHSINTEKNTKETFPSPSTFQCDSVEKTQFFILELCVHVGLEEQQTLDAGISTDGADVWMMLLN